MNTKALIVVFDALRPEFVTPELMPNLHAFQAGGVRYRNSRSTFLTETRVNQTAVVTGCTPGRSGVVANLFLATDIWPDKILNTGVEDELRAAMADSGGKLIQVPTLGEHLAAANLRFASLSAGTPGGGRLINHAAETYGTFRLAMRALEATQPSGALEQVLDRVGQTPEYQRPATAWISWAVDAYLEYIVPDVDPDVMLLWLCEPDETFHYHGIGSEESIETIRHADREFGRILQRQQHALDKGQLQIIAMSDHGQISLRGESLDLCSLLNSAGLRASVSPGPDVDYVVRVHNAGGIWVRDDDPVLSRKLVEFLLQTDWCGPLFSRGGIANTLPLGAVGLDHPRAPTVAITMRTDDSENAFGIAGHTLHAAPYPVGGGCHGGLSRYELGNFLSMGGSAFKQDATVLSPASNIDITPTILHLLGVEALNRLDGRVLREALDSESDEMDFEPTEIVAQNSLGPKTHVSVTDYHGVRYLNRAWVE